MDIWNVLVIETRGLMKYFWIVLLTGVSFAHPQVQTGYDHTGAAHLLGPGIDQWGAYRFEDLCTPENRLHGGTKTCYRITLVLDKPVSNLPPDIIWAGEVEVWGDRAGHFHWAVGEWSVEMVTIDEAIREQVSWEAEKMGWKRGKSGVQLIDITVGRTTLTINASKD